MSKPEKRIAPSPGEGVVDERRCKKTMPTGKRCGAYARTGKTHCFRHDPQSAKEAAVASRQGGDCNRGPVLNGASDVDLKSTDDVRHLLCETISQVRTGLIDLKVANCVGFLVGHLMRAIEQGDVEKRMEALEEIVHGER